MSPDIQHGPNPQGFGPCCLPGVQSKRTREHLDRSSSLHRHRATRPQYPRCVQCPRRRRVVAITATALAALSACSDAPVEDGSTVEVSSSETPGPGEVSLDGLEVEVRRDPGCGCCTSWVDYLREHGATLTVVDDPARDAFRAEVGVSDDAASCHTAIVDGYAVEGHVPIEAIRQLVDQQPDVVGLALPGCLVTPLEWVATPQRGERRLL